MDIYLNPSQSHEEAVQQTLRLQCDAFTRAFVLMKEKDNVTFDDVIRVLADAEREAQYVCGFVGLENDTESKTALVKKLRKDELIREDTDGNIVLTTKDERRGQKKPLPSEIERHIPAD